MGYKDIVIAKCTIDGNSWYYPEKTDTYQHNRITANHVVLNDSLGVDFPADLNWETTNHVLRYSFAERFLQETNEQIVIVLGAPDN